MAHRHWQQHENEQFNDTISWFDRYTQFEFQYSVALKPNVEHQHIEHSNSFVHLIIFGLWIYQIHKWLHIQTKTQFTIKMFKLQNLFFLSKLHQIESFLFWLQINWLQSMTSIYRKCAWRWSHFSLPFSATLFVF